MKEYISFDSHKHYTLAEREDVETGRTRQCRIRHTRGAIREYLSRCEPGTPVAVEATANWYWIVQEIEEARQKPLLVHPRKAKLMTGLINKSDKLDVHGLNLLQRNKTLPTVWIPPAELRDLRELTRVRMVLARTRTQLKNRIQATLSKYGLVVEGFSDPHGQGARGEMSRQIARLPEQTRYVTEMLREQLEFVQRQIHEQEKRLKALVSITPEIELLMSLPGIGVILGSVCALEIGDIGRFPSAEHLAAYAGTTPRVHSSGDKTRYGGLRPDVNRYLRWAFIEAGHSTALNCERRPERHVSRLYRRLRARRGHYKAVGAVARHLAEASYYVLSKKEPYRDPALHTEGRQALAQGRTREV
jgi:transposase